MRDGMIALDSKRGKELGFTRDSYDGYLWKSGDAIYLSFIVSKKKGNLLKLVNRIHSLGLVVKIPTPLGRMQEIVANNGYERTIEHWEEIGENCEVWVLSLPVKEKLP